MTPWTIAYQAPLSMEFSRQEYWSGVPLPSPGDLPNLGIKPRSLALQADVLPSEPPGNIYALVSASFSSFLFLHCFSFFKSSLIQTGKFSQIIQSDKIHLFKVYLQLTDF